MGMLAMAAFLLNLPFGAWRVRTKKMTIPWFLSIHAPIPFAFLLRRLLDLSIWYVALTLIFAVAGQLIGGRLWAPAPEKKTQTS
jgi:hypothetical protein